jgi:DASS family divalent anion:Na+ symporter
MASNNLKYKKLCLIILLGLTLWFIPHPQEIEPKAWHLFAIFITTIFAIIVNPLPIGAIAILSMFTSIITHTIELEQALGAFGSHIVWLVVFAFFISRGFIKTGLGKRIAYYFISKIGKSTLGLSYGLVFTDFVLSPMIPSVTARGGGIIFPIAKALADEYAKKSLSKSEKNHTGGFLMQVCFQSNVITSAMFLTAMAANPLIVTLASQMGIIITWETWALGAIVPGIVSLLLSPLVLYVICPPSVRVIEEAQEQAKEALVAMGKISKQEIIMLFTFLLLITCWILDIRIGLNATTTALLGFSLLLITGVLHWNDALNEKGAWDTFAWFATLVMMSGYLTKFGMMGWIGEQMQMFVNQEKIYLSAAILALLYFYIHYFFASITAHITVLYAAFLILFINLGLPALISALVLAYFSSLSGGLTHFGIGSAPVFFESGYLSTREWWKVGGIMSLVNILIWCLVGGGWWYILGWW